LLPRIHASLSTFRHFPPALRRPPRLTFAVAAATIATAAAVTATAAAASTPPGPGATATVVSQAAATGHAAPHTGLAASHSGLAAQINPHGQERPARPAAGPGPANPGQRHKPAAQARPVHKATAARQAKTAVHQVKAVHQGKPAHQAAAARQAKPVHEAKPAHQAKPAHRQRAHRLHHPYRIYDAVNPAAIPARQAAAVYSNGRYFARPSQLRHLGHALWIDVTGRNYQASVLDVEPGDATPAQAASWVWHRLHAHHRAVARIYTMRSEWPAVKAAVAALPSWMRARVDWWIADPTGVPHIVSGSHATQWYWGQRYDLSSASPGF